MLSFGHWVPGYVNPLDGDIVTTDKSKYEVNKGWDRKSKVTKLNVQCGLLERPAVATY